MDRLINCPHLFQFLYNEIGILRAIGASKGNISSIFNAETFIIGTLSGLFGSTLN